MGRVEFCRCRCVGAVVHSKAGSILSLRVACGVLSKETRWLVIRLPGIIPPGAELQFQTSWEHTCHNGGATRLLGSVLLYPALGLVGRWLIGKPLDSSFPEGWLRRAPRWVWPPDFWGTA